MSVENPFLAAALDFAARGYPVFPCSPANKAPLLPKDKDAAGKPIPNSGGVNKASTDPDQIAAWWKRWPKALVGLATGHNRMFVVDFDPRIDEDTGEEWTLDRLKAELEAQMGCELPVSLAARTQSDGVHVWLYWPDDGGPEIRNRGNLPQHVDVRGKGGYVIVPPSVMANGRRYRWLRDDPSVPIAVAPDALITILRSRADGSQDGGSQADGERITRSGQGAAPVRRLDPDDAATEAVTRWALAALDAECSEIERSGTGDRNKQLNRSAFRVAQLVAAGALRASIARAAVEDAARANPGRDSDAQLIATIESGWRAGMEKARDITDVASAARERALRRNGGPGPRPSAPHPAGGDAGGAGGARGPDPVDAGAASAPSAPSARQDDPPPSVGDPGPSLEDYGLSSFHMEGQEGGPPDIKGGEGGDAGPINAFDGFDGDRIKVDADPALDRKCAFLPQTDLGNAERFRLRYGHLFRFCAEVGWLRWEGRRWEQLTEEKDKLPAEVMMAVFQTVRAIGNEAKLVNDSGCKGEDVGGLDFIVKATKNTVTMFSDTIAAHAKSSEGASRLNAIPGLVKSFANVVIKASALDVDREAINVLNGTLRIVTNGNMPAMKLFPHDPADLITKVCNVVYDPDAEAPDYDAFLSRVMPDADDRRFLHQWAGLSSTGDVSYHKMAFFYGKGRNGKSTWVDTIAWILGDYSATIKFDSFLEQANKRKGSDATPDIAQLPGVRFLRASEPEKGAKLAEALIKEMTGGEEIQARHLNKGFFSFLPSFKLTASGNYRPKVTGTDDGIWGRLRLILWGVRIPDKDIDRELPAKLKKQGSGILNHMLAGLIDLKMNGLIESANIKEATRKYREASDQLGRFLSDCTEDVSGERSRSSIMLDVFNAWAKATNGAEWQPQGFAKAMEDRGYERTTSNGVWWLDIRLTVDVDDIQAGDFGPPRAAAAPDGGEGGGADPPAAGSAPDPDDEYPVPF